MMNSVCYSKVIIVLCIAFSIVSGKPRSGFFNAITLQSCGKALVSNTYPFIPDVHRIVGGDYARPGQMPFLVSLREEDTHGFEHACGASILNENWVVTAAHCIDYVSSPEKYEILAGLLKLSEERTPTVKLYKISKIVIHPDYDDDTMHNDIALLQTAQPIDITGSNGYINGICLPKNQEDPVGFATVAGWGHTVESGENSDTLQYVLVPIIHRDMCNHAYDENPYDDEDEILETMICAGMTGRDSCQNDSGGPLFQTDKKGVSTLIGIVSHGAGCGVKYYPGIYTKISMYQDWMTRVMS